MNICYLDFWPGFDPNCNWFNLLFRDIFSDKEINFNASKKEADIIIASSFGNERYTVLKLNPRAKKIFYTGENERPDLNFGDYSLSFDFDTYGGRNFRLPHWYLYVNWWGEPNFPHARISIEMLNKKWDPEEIYDRENFCSIVIGNPVQNRLEVAHKLNEYKSVHGFGKVFGRQFDSCKIDLLKNFRWNICFENSIREGYVTEKLLEAKVAGCIPIYYGDISVNRDFNEKCFINYSESKSIYELYDKIVSYENTKSSFINIVSQPLFDKIPTLGELKHFLRKEKFI